MCRFSNVFVLTKPHVYMAGYFDLLLWKRVAVQCVRIDLGEKWMIIRLGLLMVCAGRAASDVVGLFSFSLSFPLSPLLLWYYTAHFNDEHTCRSCCFSSLRLCSTSHPPDQLHALHLTLVTCPTLPDSLPCLLSLDLRVRVQGRLRIRCLAMYIYDHVPIHGDSARAVTKGMGVSRSRPPAVY